MNSKVKVEFESKSYNESFARMVIAAFVTLLDPTIEELCDVKMAVSEAVTNSIIHGYDEREDGKIIIEAECFDDNTIKVVVIDYGKGIEDINKAREAMYTTKPEKERSGMGFTVMEAFMDSVEVESTLDKGTKVVLIKKFQSVS